MGLTGLVLVGIGLMLAVGLWATRGQSGYPHLLWAVWTLMIGCGHAFAACLLSTLEEEDATRELDSRTQSARIMPEFYIHDPDPLVSREAHAYYPYEDDPLEPH